MRVRWSEIDAQKIVFNGHYLTYFDTALAGYWRALAVPYAESMHALGGDLYVRKATLEYEASAMYDDVIDVGVRCARIGNTSLTFEAVVFRDGRRLVIGELVYVFADPAVQRPRPLPAALRDLLDAYERGEPPVEVRLGSWDELGTDAMRIRSEVFVDEQKVPAELEHDEADAEALHAVAYNRLGAAVATARVLDLGAAAVKVGRMAVRRTLRASGVGRTVLDAVLAAAAARGAREAVLHAQTAAAGFYTRAGFVAHGPGFVEAGIDHVEMRRGL
nr:YbgC/FadM family acyl-CoA thioesterase [Schlegelella koreensis]